jgi:cell division protein FtsB
MSIGYFSYHALQGQSGLSTMVSLTHQIEQARENLDQVRSQRLTMEHHVTLLRPESLDLDLLDERARQSLGYTGEGEEIYLIEKQ